MDKARLITSIQKVRVVGGISKLNEPVDSMNKTIDSLCKDTTELSELLVKHFANNRGNQYFVLSENSKKMAKNLEEVAQVMNNMQKQIIDFQIATNGFNDQKLAVGSVKKRTQIEVKAKVESPDAATDFTEIKMVQSKVDEYCGKTDKTIKQLVNDKNGVGKIWIDPQYQNFSKYIDNTYQLVSNYVKVLRTYSEYLKGKIREYERRSNEIR